MSAPGYQLPRDPTAVMGARIGAWIVDALLVALLVIFLAPSPLNPLAEYHDIEGTGLDGWEACEIIEDSDDTSVCFPIGDRVYVTEDGATALPVFALLLYGLLVQGVLQGVTGWTPGKLLFGLRGVGEGGQHAGVGRALLRTLLWIVDAQPCGIPLVGGITGLTSTGHRRVGDMAARTYVIRASEVGQPVRVPGVPAAYAGAPNYAGYPGYGTPTTYPTPPGAYGSGQWGAAPSPPGGTGPWSTAPGTPGAPGAPGSPGVPGAPEPPRPAPPTPTPTPTPGSDERPAPGEPGASGLTEAFSPAGGTESSPTSPTSPVSPKPEVAAEAVRAPEDAPAAPSSTADEAPPPSMSGETDMVQREVVAVPEAETTAKAEEPAEPEKAEEPERTESPPIEVGPSSPPPEGTRPEYNPQWDAARGTYIQWDANRSRWLQWDDTAKEWKPL